MNEHHLTDEELVAFARDRMSDAAYATKAEHLASCEQCADRLLAVEAVDEALRDDATWAVADELDTGGDVRVLRAFAAQLAEEDAAAKALLAPLLAAPAALVWADIARKRRYHTGGVVRVLTEFAQQLCERRPLQALNVADAAIEVSQWLPDDVYPFGAVWDMRGAAAKARANALRYLGRFPEALDALGHAERAYRKHDDDFGLAAVKYVRAQILREQDRYPEALRNVRESGETFLHLRQTERYFSARIVEGQIYFAIQDYERAADIFAQILAYGEGANDHSWIARSTLCLGNVHLERNELPHAFDLFTRAAAMFREVDLPTEAARADWRLALVFLRLGRSDGLQRLRDTRTSFLDFGMSIDAALVTLDLADALLVRGTATEIPRLLTGVIDTFLASGKFLGALTALAYLREAAALRRLTPAMVGYVRAFLYRVARQPELAFAPPV